MNPWFAIARDAAKLAMDSQAVVAMRLTRFARSAKPDWAEARRMTSEKAHALAQVQLATALWMFSGRHGPALARRTIGVYGKRVRANRRRLSRKP